MNEFIEKLIGRLEEKKETYKEIRKNTHCRRTEMDDCDSCIADNKLQNRLETIDNVIEIVNQLAEEYKGHKDKDCSKCSRRSWYQKGYADAEKK